MTDDELRYDDRVEQMMQSINESSQTYLTEGIKADAPAIGALRFHRADATDETPVRQSSAIALAQSHAPDGVGVESEQLGDHTVEVRVYEDPR